MTASIQIGEFTLSPCPHGGIWMARPDGEGMQLREGATLDELATLLEAFWAEYF